MYGGALGKKTSRPLLLPGFDAPGRHQHNHHLHHHWCHHWYHYCYCSCHQYIQQQPFTTSNKLFWLFGQLLCWRTKKQFQFRIKSLAAASSIVFRGEERERVGLERRKEWQLVTPPPPHPNISKERDTTWTRIMLMGDCLQEQGQDFVVISSLERDLCPLLSFRACPKQRHSSDRAKLIGGQFGLLVNIVVFLDHD